MAQFIFSLSLIFRMHIKYRRDVTVDVVHSSCSSFFYRCARYLHDELDEKNEQKPLFIT